MLNLASQRVQSDSIQVATRVVSKRGPRVLGTGPPKSGTDTVLRSGPIRDGAARASRDHEDEDEYADEYADEDEDEDKDEDEEEERRRHLASSSEQNEPKAPRIESPDDSENNLDKR